MSNKNISKMFMILIINISCISNDIEKSQIDIKSITTYEMPYSISSLNNSDTINSIITRKHYGDNNRLLRKEVDELNEMKREVTYYSYDGHVLINDSIYNSKEDALFAKNSYYYPDKNTVVIVSNFLSIGLNKEAYTIQTKDKRHLLREILILHGSTSANVFSAVYEYNNHDDVILELRRSNKQLVTKISYSYIEYDKEGNWLKRIVYKNKIPYKIEYRNIKYK